MQTEAEHLFEARSEKLSSMVSHLNALSPRGVMKRGYALVEASRGYIGSVKKIEVGEAAKIHLHDGTLDSQITGKHE